MVNLKITMRVGAEQERERKTEKERVGEKGKERQNHWVGRMSEGRMA